MSRLTHGRVKRIHAEFRGDEALEFDIPEVSLRLGDVARTRIEADTLLTRLAYIDGAPIESEADGARVLSIAKEAGR